MLCLLSRLLITVGLPITFCLQRECNDHSFIKAFIEHNTEVLCCHGAYQSEEDGVIGAVLEEA